MRSAITLVFAAGSLAALTPACKPSAGKSCDKEDAVVCADAKTQLACTAGTWVEIACKGPDGCAGKDARCDLSGNAPGDPCAKRSEGTFCSPDRKARLRCDKGKITREECVGYGGCSKLAVGFSCDRGEPTVGEPCGDETLPTCSFDKTHRFVCHQNKWVAGVTCRGPDKCDDRTGCDRTRALEGDACDLQQESHGTCSLDGSSVLRCEHERFVVAERCPAGKHCDGKSGFLGSDYLMEQAACK